MSDQIKNSPLVSVIIPVYNRGHLLNRAVDSVFVQTFTNWELFIVDDGSTDNTEDVVKEILKQDKRVFYIKNDTNKGVSVSRNVAIGKASGVYVAFLDSDDVWLPEKLEQQVGVFENGDDKLGLVYISAYFVNNFDGSSRIKKASMSGSLYEEQLAYNIVGGASRVMVKMQCLTVCGCFDENIACNEDWDLWIRIAKSYTIAAEPAPLVYYYEGNTDSLSINTQGLIDGYEALWKKYNIESLSPYIRGAHYLRLGHRLFYYGDVLNGRKYLWWSVKVEPFRIKNLVIFLLSFLGVRLYRRFTFLVMKFG